MSAMPREESGSHEAAERASRQAIRRFLHETDVMTLSTVDADGWPHATILYFVCDDRLCLYFFSNPQTAHCQHLSRNSAAAAAVVEPMDQWEAGRGVQMRGRCAPVEADLVNDVRALFDSKYPDISHAGSHLRTLEASQYFRFCPTWARWIDNFTSYGDSVELVFESE